MTLRTIWEVQCDNCLENSEFIPNIEEEVLKWVKNGGWVQKRIGNIINHYCPKCLNWPQWKEGTINCLH